MSKDKPRINIHKINSALFDTQYVIANKGDSFEICDEQLPKGFNLVTILENLDDVLWFIVENCQISRK